MLSQIQRFGGAMFTPVLLFPFAGIVVGIAIMLRNPMFVGEALTAPDSLFAQIVYIIEEGGWTVFRNMPLIFAVGLPIGLAKQAQGRACLAVLVSFMTWNYFINAMGMTSFCAVNHAEHGRIIELFESGTAEELSRYVTQVHWSFNWQQGTES